MEDISKLNDYLSIIEIESIINDFLKYYDDKILSKNDKIYAYDQLCEIADRQCNTYTLLDKELQSKVTSFLIKYIDFNDFDIMDAILYIIPNLGLKKAFDFILNNKNQISSYEIKKLLDVCCLEYGENVEDPYSGMK